MPQQNTLGVIRNMICHCTFTNAFHCVSGSFLFLFVVDVAAVVVVVVYNSYHSAT